MNVVNYLVSHWDIITLVIAVVAAIIFAIFKGNKSVVMSMLNALVTEAEKQFGAGTGTLKLSAVIAEIYPKLPTVIKTFISDKTLTKWVEDALAAAKEQWKKNGNLAEYINPVATEGSAETQSSDETADS